MVVALTVDDGPTVEDLDGQRSREEKRRENQQSSRCDTEILYGRRDSSVAGVDDESIQPVTIRLGHADR